MHARGLGPRRVLRVLALPYPQILPSVCGNCVGTLISGTFAAQWPACTCPCQPSRPALRLSAHDSGSGWLAKPCLCDFYIHDSTPVYPGALPLSPAPSANPSDFAGPRRPRLFWIPKAQRGALWAASEGRHQRSTQTSAQISAHDP